MKRIFKGSLDISSLELRRIELADSTGIESLCRIHPGRLLNLWPYSLFEKGSLHIGERKLRQDTW